jgi:pimeloyl-ACP methyl ester carboxylesterase
VRQLAGIRPVADLPQRDVQHMGEIKREGYQIEKLILHPEDGIRLPALAFVPERLKGDALLYLHGDGKQADAGEGGPIEQLVKEGHLVLAVDLRGLGETQRTGGGNLGRLFGDWQTNLLGYLLAQPIVGMRTEDTLVAARLLQSYRTEKPRAAVRVVGVGEAGPAVLHAAALEPELFRHVTLRRSLVSWANLVRTPDSRHQLVNVVPGALRKYDLPDLVAAIGSERIRIEEPVDARGELID